MPEWWCNDVYFMSLHVVTSTAHGDEAIQKLLFLNKRSKSRTAATLVAGGPAGVCMCVCILCMCLYMSCIGYCVVISLSQLYHWFAFILHSSESCGVYCYALCSVFHCVCMHVCTCVCIYVYMYVCVCVCVTFYMQHTNLCMQDTSTSGMFMIALDQWDAFQQ